MENVINSTISKYNDLLSNDKLFSALFDNMFEGAFLVGTDKKIKYWSKTAEMITGYDTQEALEMYCSYKGIKHFDKNGEKLYDKDYLLTKCLNTGEIVTKKGAIMHKKGFLLPVLITVIPIKDEESKVVGALEIFLDDSAQDDLDKAHEQLKEVTIKDELTNLYTRNEIMERIAAEIEKADRYEVPVCLCICDIDDFKDINEKYGKHVGDIVLKAISDVIRTNLRRTDIIARFGGEEFIILLPMIDLHRASIAIEKLQRAIDNTIIEVLAKNEKVRLSYGLTEIAKNDSIEAFVDRAESALYKAKILGKNRIEIFA